MVFLCICIFSLLWWNVFFGSSFSTDEAGGELGVGGSVLGRPHRALLRYVVTTVLGLFLTRWWVLGGTSVLSSDSCPEWHLHYYVMLTAAHRSGPITSLSIPGTEAVSFPLHWTLSPLRVKAGSVLLNLVAVDSFLCYQEQVNTMLSCSSHVFFSE